MLAGDPDLSHITKKDYDYVYEPAEDSFLFMDALKADLPFLKKCLPKCPKSLEIGSGSGIITSYLANLVGPGIYLASDINPRAAAVANMTFKRNKVPQFDLLPSSADWLPGARGS